MEQIEQLKAMRDAAQARIAATPDYKLLISLTALIAELETVFGMLPPAPAVELPVADQRKQPVPEAGHAGGEPDATAGNGASGTPAGGILGNGSHDRSDNGSNGGSENGSGNGSNSDSDHENAVQAVVNAEEEALDQAVADLEAELMSAGVAASPRGTGSRY